MPIVTINGKQITAASDQTILQVARNNGIFIPTLCHHPGLAPYGACRICLVEVKAGLRPGLISSCTLPVLDGLVIETESPSVKNGRRFVAQLLLARAPGSKEIQALASSLGVSETSFPEKDERCILCGRCVRACKTLGVHAISFSYRGSRRKVSVPFDKPSDRCLACQACVTVCPTGAISSKITPNAVEMVEWHTVQELQNCAMCGGPYVSPRMHTHLLKNVFSEKLHRLDLCPPCRRKETAGDLRAAAKIAQSGESANNYENS